MVLGIPLYPFQNVAQLLHLVLSTLKEEAESLVGSLGFVVHIFYTVTLMLNLYGVMLLILRRTQIKIEKGHCSTSSLQYKQFCY